MQESKAGLNGRQMRLGGVRKILADAYEDQQRREIAEHDGERLLRSFGAKEVEDSVKWREKAQRRSTWQP